MSTLPEIPRRSAVLQSFKDAGGKLAAVYPIHYPRALLRAHGYLPVEVWGPAKIRGEQGSEHVQAYVCSIVRNGLGFLLEGGLDAVELLVVPHCCDSLQGLGSMLLDFIKPPQPVLPIYLPRGAVGETQLEFLTLELAAMAGRLAEISGIRPDAATLLEAARREERADAQLVQLHRHRAKLPVDDRDFYRLVRSREYLPAERFVELAEQALALPERGDPPVGIPLLISGIVPEPANLFDALAAAGARIGADDLAATGRRLYQPGRSEDGLRRMAESLLSGPPDPMLGAPIADRLSSLRTRIQASGARGVLFHTVKFCEPELYDLPQLRKPLEQDGVPCLELEYDIADPLAGQALTRLEAFVEMLS